MGMLSSPPFGILNHAYIIQWHPTRVPKPYYSKKDKYTCPDKNPKASLNQNPTQKALPASPLLALNLSARNRASRLDPSPSCQVHMALVNPALCSLYFYSSRHSKLPTTPVRSCLIAPT